MKKELEELKAWKAKYEKEQALERNKTYDIYSLDDEKIKEEAINNINVKKYLEGNEIIKIIVVKNKIVNIVVK